MSWEAEIGMPELVPGVDCDYRDENVNDIMADEPERIEACKAGVLAQQASWEADVDRLHAIRRTDDKRRGIKPRTVDVIEVEISNWEQVQQ